MPLRSSGRPAWLQKKFVRVHQQFLQLGIRCAHGVRVFGAIFEDRNADAEVPHNLFDGHLRGFADLFVACM